MSSCGQPVNPQQLGNCKDVICDTKRVPSDICIPTSVTIEGCLKFYKSSGTVFEDCVCGSLVGGLDIYFFNKSDSTLTLKEPESGRDNFITFDDGECNLGVWIVAPPTEIKANDAFFARAWPGNAYADKCNVKTTYTLNLTYESGDGSINLLLEKIRAADGKCVYTPGIIIGSKTSGNLTFDTSLPASNTQVGPKNSSTYSAIVTTGGNGGNGGFKLTKNEIIIIVVVVVFVFILFIGVIYASVPR